MSKYSFIMGYTLIIAEKPSAARKIATFLSTGKVETVKEGKVSYFKLEHKGNPIVVVSAAGHLYSLAEDTKTQGYPVFDIKWFPLYEINKEMKHTKQFLEVIKKLAKNASDFVIACDYDTEGEVIGYNILRFACGQKDAKRMKFSTLTKPEIVSAFENAMPTLDWGQANAGLARHMIDWLYGINLSRALMSSIKKAGIYKVMSIGRVQGPTLKLVVDREEQIKNFKPKKYWELFVVGEINKQEIKAQHTNGRFDEENKAKEVYNKVLNKNGIVSQVKKSSKKVLPPYPFDLTTLQTEAYAAFRFSPKKTLELAQQLYLSSYISYPRTSSQKLPSSINFKAILNNLSSVKDYSSWAKELLKNQKLKPHNGKKDDPAHPAIYPTGIIPKNLNNDLMKLYDLIVRRFLATFSEPAVRETLSVKIDINGEPFAFSATRTTEKGWFEIYEKYLRLDEDLFIEIKEGDAFLNKKTLLEEKETKPPKRFTQSSLIKEMEKHNLGTKATRAQIIDTLYQRGYIINDPIEATDFGIATVKVLEKYSPKIVDFKLTGHLEEQMDLIRETKKKADELIDESKEVLKQVLSDFKQKENDIGKELKQSFIETNKKANSFGPCPQCKEGTLVLRDGKFGKFLACSRYPECKFTLSLPKNANIKPTDNVCDACGYPLVKIRYGKKKAVIACINPNCPKKNKSEEEQNILKEEAKSKKCPKCGASLVLRKGPHGYFFGCSNYPKCNYLEPLAENKKS